MNYSKSQKYFFVVPVDVLQVFPVVPSPPESNGRRNERWRCWKIEDLIRYIDIDRFTKRSRDVAGVFWDTREEVGNNVRLAGDMFDLHGELTEEEHPSGLARRKVLLRKYRGHGLGVGEQSKFTASQEVVIGLEEVDDGEKFLLVCRIVGLCRIKHTRMEKYRFCCFQRFSSRNHTTTSNQRCICINEYLVGIRDKRHWTSHLSTQN